MSKDNSMFNKTFIIGFLCNFFAALNFSNNAIMPLYVKHEGGEAQAIGLFMATFSLAAVAGRPVVGIMLDKLGSMWVLLMGTFIMGISPLGYYLLYDKGLVSLVWVVRVLQGFGYGAHFTAYFTYAAQTASEGKRNEMVSKYGISGMLAFIVGPYMGEQIVERLGLPYFFLAISLFAFLGFVMVLLIPGIRDKKVSENVEKEISTSSRSSFIKSLGFITILAALLSFAFTTPSSFLAPFAQEKGITGFGLFYTSFSICGIIIRLIGSHWGDRFGLRRILVPGYLLYAISLMILHFSENLGMVIIAGVFLGLAHSISFPAVTTLGYNIAPARYKGRIMALTTGLMDSGAMLSAITLGFVAAECGYPKVFLVAAFAPVIAATVLLINMFKDPTIIRNTR